MILDNLIAQGKAKPMIMVNPLGYGLPDKSAGAMSGGKMMANFTAALIDEVMPQVEKQYHVSKDRTQRAIAGLSMGGAEALYVGLNHTDRFASIASFSGAFVMWPRPSAGTPEPPAAAGPTRPAGATGRGGPPSLDPTVFEKNFPDLDPKVNSRLNLLWLACGTADGLITVNRQFTAWLKSKDIHYTSEEIPDMAHVWPLWRQNLAELAPLLFQANPQSR